MDEHSEAGFTPTISGGVPDPPVWTSSVLSVPDPAEARVVRSELERKPYRGSARADRFHRGAASESSTHNVGHHIS